MKLFVRLDDRLAAALEAETARTQRPSSALVRDAIREPAFERLGTHREVFGLPLEAMTPAADKKALS
jgi:predicted transcriptional regulator